MRSPSTNPSKAKNRSVVCRTCAGSPLDGVALFADGYVDDGKGVRRPRRFCALHLPPAAARARFDRHLKGDAILDPDIAAIFAARFAGDAS